jgi:hypothetical protein
MNNLLLDLVLAVHGWWDHWQHLSKLTANASVGGILWAEKGKDGILDNLAVQLDCHRQYAVHLIGITQHLYAKLTTIETIDGKIIESRDNPRAAFKGHAVETKWDNLHLVYFSGYAM